MKYRKSEWQILRSFLKNIQAKSDDLLKVFLKEILKEKMIHWKEILQNRMTDLPEVLEGIQAKSDLLTDFLRDIQRKSNKHWEM